MLRNAFFLAAAILLVSRLAFANAPPPPPDLKDLPTPEPAPAQKITKFTSPVEIRHADLSKEGDGIKAKISLPRKTFSMVQPTKKEAGLPWWTTIIAALALSSGAISLLFAARGSKTARNVAVAGVMVAVASGGYALGNLAIPPDGAVKPRQPAVENVVIEINDGEAVVITLPK